MTMISCAQTMSSEHQTTSRTTGQDKRPNRARQILFFLFFYLFDNYLTLSLSLWFLLERSEESVLLVASLEGTVLIA